MSEDREKLRPRDAKSHGLRAGTDAVIAEIASRQDGRATRAQLVAAGVSDTAIAHRVATGR